MKTKNIKTQRELIESIKDIVLQISGNEKNYLWAMGWIKKDIKAFMKNIAKDIEKYSMPPLYVISSKKFKNLNDAIAQMIKYDKAGTLDRKAHVYQIVHAVKFKK